MEWRGLRNLHTNGGGRFLKKTTAGEIIHTQGEPLKALKRRIQLLTRRFLTEWVHNRANAGAEGKTMRTATGGFPELRHAGRGLRPYVNPAKHISTVFLKQYVTLIVP